MTIASSTVPSSDRPTSMEVGIQAALLVRDLETALRTLEESIPVLKRWINYSSPRTSHTLGSLISAAKRFMENRPDIFGWRFDHASQKRYYLIESGDKIVAQAERLASAPSGPDASAEISEPSTMAASGVERSDRT